PATGAFGTSVTIPGEGTYTVDPATGVVTFDPLPAFTGAATPLTYRVTDGDGVTATSTITITVTPIVPVAGDDEAATPSDTPVTVDVLADDRPGAASAPLDPTSVRLRDPADGVFKTSVTIPSEGTYTVDPATGAVTFDPVPTFSGAATPITYRVADDNGTTDTATLTVQVAGPPTARPDVASTPQDVDVTLRPLTNDVAGSNGGAPLDPSSLRLLDPVTGTYQSSVTIPDEGTYTVNSDGSVTFDPVPAFTGAATALTYRVADQDGVTATSTITVTVTPIVPLAADDVASAPNGTPVSVDLLANDRPGAPSAPLDPSSVRLLDPADGQYKTSVDVPDVGSYVLDPGTGTVTFTPVAGFSGVAPPLTYRVADENGTTSIATLTVTTGEPPVAEPDTATTAQDESVSIDVLANDDPGASPLDPTTVRLQDPVDGQYKTTVTVPGEGTWTVNPTTGAVTFDPEPTFTGAATPLTYRVQDEDGLPTTASITVTVTEKPPTAQPDTARTDQGLPVTVSVLGNDTPSPGVPLNPSTVQLRDPATGDLVTTLTVAGEGTYRVQDDGRVTFTPDPLFTGKASPVTYVVEDAQGRAVDSTLTVTVDAARIAQNDQVTGRPGQPIVVDVLGNDTIVPGVPLDPSTLRLVVPGTGELVLRIEVPGEGVWTVDLTRGVLVFTPEPGFRGETAPVTYYVEDVQGRSTTAQATVEVLGVILSRPRPGQDGVGPGQDGGAAPRGLLARTGIETVALGLGGTVLVAAGLLVVGLSRRRRLEQ
ncbi:MAG: Ig-like domain-containing protein, partial [Angustibacter sp.]